MHVCTLKVASKRHGITAQAQRGGIIDFGFLGSQNTVSIEHGGVGGNRGEESNDSLSEEEEEQAY